MAGKKAGFQLVITRWLPKATSLTPMVSFWMPFVNRTTLHHSKSSHVHISDPPLYLKHLNTLQVDIQYSNGLVFRLSGIQIGLFGIVRIKWLPKVTGQDWTFKYQTKNVQFSNGLDKMVADHKNTVGGRILNKFLIWMVGSVRFSYGELGLSQQQLIESVCYGQPTHLVSLYCSRLVWYSDC